MSRLSSSCVLDIITAAPDFFLTLCQVFAFSRVIVDQKLIRRIFTGRAFDGSGKVRTEDGYIVSKCLNGESEALGLLVDKYKESIYAFVYAKLRDRGSRNFQDAQDVTQEVFIKAYKKLRSLRRTDKRPLTLGS